MLVKLKKCIAILGFSTLITFMLLYGEFFQAPQTPVGQETIDFSPVVKKFKEFTDKLTISNRMGELAFERVYKGEGHWKIVKPRLIPAQKLRVDNLISAILEPKIVKVLRKDELNLRSYALDKPLFESRFINSMGEELSFHVGMRNTIDNTLFATFGNWDYIFQLEAFPFHLEALNLEHFIDSKIFTMDNSEILALTIQKKRVGRKLIQKKYTKTNDEWGNDQNLKDLLNYKARIILDKMDTKLSEKVQHYFERALYRLKIEMNKGEMIDYHISLPIDGSLATMMKVPKRKHVLVLAQNRDHPYIVPVSLLKELEALLN